jgi:ELWxxDGT repeat protein
LFDITNPDFTLLGSNALFEGIDSSGHFSVWITNGTSSGTSELPVADGYSGNTIASQGPYFTTFGSEAVFLALNASDVPTIGVTDGTAAGTSALTVPNAYAGGLFDWSTTANPDFTALNGEVLFEGEDASGHLGLWVTNGTAFGTSELTGIANAYGGGLFSNGSGSINPDITVDGNVAFFDGYDGSGHLQLWVTNGTAAGTSEVVAAGVDPTTGLNPTGFIALPVSPQPAPDDFTGNGISDILWQNTDGQALIWLMDGTTITGGGPVGGNPGPDWTVAGAGDFNGNGISDIVLQNTDGQVGIWMMNGTTLTSTAVVGGPVPGWNVVGTGDFNGNGVSDIVLQDADGQVGIWVMNGTTLTSTAVVGGPVPGWKAVGTGDFNGNGVSDIVLQNTDGQVGIWMMSGTTLANAAVVGSNPGPSWQVVGTGDFTGNGLSDILLQNTDGPAAIWLMNGTTFTGGALVGPNLGSSWKIVGTGDYTGNGRWDILWQNTDGQAAIWLMNGTTFTGGALVGSNPGPTWHIPTTG